MTYRLTLLLAALNVLNSEGRKLRGTETLTHMVDDALEFLGLHESAEQRTLSHLGEDAVNFLNEENHIERIVGGWKPQVNQYPSFAWVLDETITFENGESKKRWGRSNCGGTLISDRHVLTAAHCVAPTSRSGMSDGVYIGAFDPYNKEEKNGGADFEFKRIAKIYYHDQFDPGNTKNDIAILEISGTTTMPRVKIADFDIVENQSLETVGFGRTSEGGPHSSFLQMTTVNKISKDKCNDIYSDRITDGMMCAQYPNRDSCQGDSGGPLYVKRDGVDYLAGVVSWGKGCARAGMAGVYADAKYYLPWIKDTICTGTNDPELCSSGQGAPTKSPTRSPSAAPTLHPTKSPTLHPTKSPTFHPTTVPVAASSSSGTTNAPTKTPTVSPTPQPTTTATTTSSDGDCPPQDDNAIVELAFRNVVRKYKCANILPGHRACGSPGAMDLCPRSCRSECYHQ